MLRSICVVFLIIFALYVFEQDALVDNTIKYAKDRASLTQKHGIRGLWNDMWCGNPKCSDE